MTDFTRTKSRFAIPDGVIYLDGNSLGPLPVAAADRISRMISEEWGKHLIKGWNVAGWMTQPRRVGDRIGRLIGAAEGTVVVGDTLDMASEKIVLVIPTQRQECCHSAGSLFMHTNGDLYISVGDNTNPFDSSGFDPIDERPGRSAWESPSGSRPRLRKRSQRRTRKGSSTGT